MQTQLPAQQAMQNQTCNEQQKPQPAQAQFDDARPAVTVQLHLQSLMANSAQTPQLKSMQSAMAASTQAKQAHSPIANATVHHSPLQNKTGISSVAQLASQYNQQGRKLTYISEQQVSSGLDASNNFTFKKKKEMTVADRGEIWMDPNAPVSGTSVKADSANIGGIYSDDSYRSPNKNHLTRCHAVNGKYGGQAIPKNLFPQTNLYNDAHSNQFEERVKANIIYASKKNIGKPITDPGYLYAYYKYNIHYPDPVTKDNFNDIEIEIDPNEFSQNGKPIPRPPMGPLVGVDQGLASLGWKHDDPADLIAAQSYRTNNPGEYAIDDKYERLSGQDRKKARKMADFAKNQLGVVNGGIKKPGKNITHPFDPSKKIKRPTEKRIKIIDDIYNKFAAGQRFAHLKTKRQKTQALVELLLKQKNELNQAIAGLKKQDELRDVVGQIMEIEPT